MNIRVIFMNITLIFMNISLIFMDTTKSLYSLKILIFMDVKLIFMVFTLVFMNIKFSCIHEYNIMGPLDYVEHSVTCYKEFPVASDHKKNARQCMTHRDAWSLKISGAGEEAH